MEEGQELNITMLPIEIITLILQYVNCKEILNFSLTCKALRQYVINNELLWKKKYKAALPPIMFQSMEKNGDGHWSHEVKHFYMVKKQVYDEIQQMSSKYYWQCGDISLEDVRNFFAIALAERVNYFYVVYVLQDLVWKTNIYLDKNCAKKPYTMTEMYYAKVALRHLVQTFLSMKWVSSHIKAELSPEIVVNFFLQWVDPFRWHSDKYVTEGIEELAASARKVIDNIQPEWASFTIQERISKNVLNEKQILSSISSVIFDLKKMRTIVPVNLETLNIMQVLKSRKPCKVSVAAIYHAIASRCEVHCELVCFPNHLFLEWRDTRGPKPVTYSINLETGEIRPKRRCPFSNNDNSTVSYTYSPDSLLQYIFTTFQLGVGETRNWNSQNAFHLLDFLGSGDSPLNPYRNFMPYLIERSHLPAIILPLDILNLHDYQILMIEILANMNPIVKTATKEFVLKRHSSRVKYAVGMMCYHKKFQYAGVIRSWDPVCDMALAERPEMELNLHFGLDQPFYHIVAVDQSMRYVAEENIAELTRPTRMFSLEEMLAREFTHFDGFAYVPNDEKRSEYPDEGSIVAVYSNRFRFRP